MDCVNLKMELCDNCIVAKNGSRSQKRKLEFELEEQENRARIELYERRTSEMEESVQVDALLIEHIKTLRIRLGKRCSICWAMNHDSKIHDKAGCEIMELFD